MDRIKLVFRALVITLCLFGLHVAVHAQHHDPDNHIDSTQQPPAHNPEGEHATPGEHGQEGGKHEEDYFGSFVFHHISDDYYFNIIGDKTTSFHLNLYLPMIIFEPGHGVDVFMSSELMHPDQNGLIRGKYVYNHGQLTIAELENGHVKLDSTGHVVGKHEAKLLGLMGGDSHVYYNSSIRP